MPSRDGETNSHDAIQCKYAVSFSQGSAVKNLHRQKEWWPGLPSHHSCLCPPEVLSAYAFAAAAGASAPSSATWMP